MNCKVVYFSKSRHTEGLAQVVGEVCGVSACKITEPHSLANVDCLFIGTGIYSGKPAQEIFTYVDNLPVNQIKHAVIFISSFTKKDQSELLVNNLRAKGIEVYPERFVGSGSFLFLKRNRADKRDYGALKRFTEKVLEDLNGK